MENGFREPALWPIWAGVSMVACGIAGGSLLPVGQFCSGTFTPQTAAQREDVARAVHMTLTTRYESACAAAAGMQAAIWVGLIVLGLLVLASGIFWRLAPMSWTFRHRVRGAVWVIWSGVVLVFAGAVGGWAIPIGKDCSGAFGSQEPAKIVTANSGSLAPLEACQKAAAQFYPFWWALIILGIAVISTGVVWAYRLLRRPDNRIVQGARAQLGLMWFGVAVAAASGIAALTLPVGDQCAAAFGDQNAAAAASAQKFGDSANMDQAVCGTAAGGFATMWWILIGVGAAVAIVGAIIGYSERRAVPAPQPHKALWPFMLGTGSSVAGIVCAFAVPVGPHCDGAFTRQYSSIITDLNRTYVGVGSTSDYTATCRASAAQFSVLWWAVIALGAAVFCLGFWMRSRARWKLDDPHHQQLIPAALPSSNIAEELEHLANLRDRGILTQAEFDARKTKILKS